MVAGVCASNAYSICHRLHHTVHTGPVPLASVSLLRSRTPHSSDFQTSCAPLPTAPLHTHSGTTVLSSWSATIVINVGGLAVALILTRAIRGTNAFRTVFFMPNLIGGIVLGYIWQILLNCALALLEQSAVGTGCHSRLLGPGNSHVLAADRLHDDHLCSRACRAYPSHSLRLRRSTAPHPGRPSGRSSCPSSCPASPSACS